MTTPTDDWPDEQAGPATTPAVLLWLDRDGTPAQSTDAATVHGVVLAVNRLVGSWKTPPAGGAEWDPAAQLGAVMLAARLWRRRATPAGVESYGDGGIAYVQRNDPDVALLLGIGAYTPPMVG